MIDYAQKIRTPAQVAIDVSREMIAEIEARANQIIAAHLETIGKLREENAWLRERIKRLEGA